MIPTREETVWARRIASLLVFMSGVLAGLLLTEVGHALL